MIRTTNKLISFSLSAILTIISWGIIFINLILRITTFWEIGLYSINITGFVFVTILLTIYTFTILFKFSGVTYFPIVLMLLHMSTLNGSMLAILFVVVNLIIMILMNTGNEPVTNKNTTFFRQTNSNQYNDNSQPKRTVDNGDVFDAEYTEKD